MKSKLRLLEEFRPGPGLAYGLIILVAFLWAASTVIGRGVHEAIPPFGMSFWRWFIAAMVLLPLVWREIPRKWALIKAHAGLIVLLGILQVVSSAVLIFGLNFTTAVNGSLINAAQPALTAIPAWFLVRDRLSPGQGLGILFAFVGVAFMITRGDLAVLTQLSFNNGDLLAVIAVAGWSSYVPLLHRLPREIGLTTSLFLILFSGSLCLIPAYVIEALYFRPMPFTAFSVTVVVTLGIIISAFSVLLWNASVRAVGPNRAVIFLNLIPVFGVVMAIGFLDERLFSFHLIGAGFVAFGIALVVLKARWRRGGEKT